jgi:hypothetical protein
MTTTEVVTTLASPLNAFKIVNTGQTVGAFTEDRDSAIRGEFGLQARMIPMHIRIHEKGREASSKNEDRKLNVEILDMSSLSPQAFLVVLFQALLQNNDNTSETSYHLTGSIDLDGYPPSPLQLWASASDTMPAAMATSMGAARQFALLYTNADRQGMVRAVNLDIEAIPHRISVDLESARLVSNNSVHAGDTVMVEATLRPWHQPERNMRIAVKLPARLEPENLRLLVSDAGTLDRSLDQPRQASHPAGLDTALALASHHHAADRIYVSLLVPETQAGMEGQTLTSLPLSMANTLEPLRASQDASLNGESAELETDAPAGGILTGFEVLNLRVEPGGGLN